MASGFSFSQGLKFLSCGRVINTLSKHLWAAEALDFIDFSDVLSYNIFKD